MLESIDINCENVYLCSNPAFFCRHVLLLKTSTHRPEISFKVKEKAWPFFVKVSLVIPCHNISEFITCISLIK